MLPAASYQLEKLFGLFDIEFSTETQTAAVECRTTPRLLLNKGFLDKYCRDDGDLFLLILHELYHVILGLTRLFPRVSPIDNIVFDAVINSMLSRTVGRTVGTSLFTRTNGYDSLPERLLRPPPGWPDEFEGAVATLPKEEQRIIGLLYGPDEPSEITYRDIYELLCKELYCQAPTESHLDRHRRIRGQGRTDLIASLNRTRVVVALTDSGHAGDLQPWVHEMIQLPKP